MKMVHRATFDAKQGLSAEQRAAWQRDGILVLEGFASAAQCEALRQRAMELALQLAPAAAGTVFSTRDQRHAQSASFEASAAGIHAFLEEEAVDAQGHLCVPVERSVNKLGHAMHDLDPLFMAFSHGPRLQAVASGIGLADARVLQSMYIFKQPGIGAEVSCHQDSTFLYTEPASVVGFWFAIDDAHRGNGCLGALPGQHRRGLRSLYRRQADGHLAMELLRPDLDWPAADAEWLEVPQGTLIVFDGQLPHLSEANRSAQSRHAYTLHAVSAAAHYPAANWLQRPGMPFKGFV